MVVRHVISAKHLCLSKSDSRLFAHATQRPKSKPFPRLRCVCVYMWLNGIACVETGKRRKTRYCGVRIRRTPDRFQRPCSNCRLSYFVHVWTVQKRKRRNCFEIPTLLVDEFKKKHFALDKDVATKCLSAHGSAEMWDPIGGKEV